MAIVPYLAASAMKAVHSSPYVIFLGDAERAELESLSRRATAPHRMVLWARIVILAAAGAGNSEIAGCLGICEDTARKWRRRYREKGLEGPRPVVAGWPPVALLLSVELLIHRSARERPAVDADEPPEGADPLLPRAAAADARHRELHERPISAESLGRELRIGAARSRQLVALVRARGNGLAPVVGTHAGGQK